MVLVIIVLGESVLLILQENNIARYSPKIDVLESVSNYILGIADGLLERLDRSLELRFSSEE